LDDQIVLYGDGIRANEMRYVFLLFGGSDNPSFKGLHVHCIEVTEYQNLARLL
jgi:hypothetical protein